MNQNKTVANQSARGDRMLILTLAIMAANLRACITGVGSLVPLIRENLGLSNASAGFITTLPIIVFALISPVASGISRRIGMGYTLTAAFIMLLIGQVIRSYFGISGLFIGSGLLAVGIAFGNVLLISIIKLRFKQRIGFVTSIYSSSMVVAASISVACGVPIAETLGLGWRNALGMWIPLAFIGIILWIVRIRRDPDIDRPPEEISRDIPYSRIAYRIPMAWCFAFFFGMQTLLFFGFSAWIPSILQTRGYTLEQSAFFALYLQVMNLPSTLLVPFLCTRRRDQRVLIFIFGGMLCLGSLGFLFARGIVPILITLTAASLGSGSSLAFSNTFISLRTDNAVQSAALAGMGQTVGYVVGAAGPVLLGLIFDVTNSWTLPLIILIFFTIVFFILGLFLARDRSFFSEYFAKTNNHA